MGCLYRITFPGGKSYIGATMFTAEARFAEHVYNSKRGLQRGINRALRKYGQDAAILETLVISDSWSYLIDLERRAIAAFDTNGLGGYNMTDGGEGAKGYRHTPASLEKMGATHVGNKYRLGVMHTEAAKQKMSAAKLGKPMSEAARKSISVSLVGNKRSLGRKQCERERADRSGAQTGIAKGASSGHVGVSKHKKGWRAHITKGGKFVHLGYHTSIDSAIAARRSAELDYSKGSP